MTTAFTVVIPSRYASTRLPGKPLQMIGDKPMVQLVWEQACKSSAERVVVATDDPRIIEACKGFGAEAVLTREDHNSGTDRLAEVATKLGLAPDAIVVNVQGDEPLIPPSIIDQVAANLAADAEARMATLAEPIEDLETLLNPSVVKVVSDINGLALTFSRSVLPWARDAFATRPDVLPEGVPYRRHIGIYAYRAGFLHDFVSWGPCWLEDTECLEQFTDDFREEGPRTVRAANLVHLRSDFTFKLADNNKIGDLLQALHPTPAVCGLPKREAFKFIVKNEHTPRRYYSGFMGPVAQEDTHLYVSLRCMNIDGDVCHLYAGGGLLKDSVEEQEWLETEAKMETMKKLLYVQQ